MELAEGVPVTYPIHVEWGLRYPPDEPTFPVDGILRLNIRILPKSFTPLENGNVWYDRVLEVYGGKDGDPYYTEKAPLVHEAILDILYTLGNNWIASGFSTYFGANNLDEFVIEEGFALDWFKHFGW